MTSELAHAVWRAKYRLRAEHGSTEGSIGDTWARVASAAASVEKRPAEWQRRFEDLLDEFRFLPGGRILAGAGSGRRVTLFNCFAAGRLEDSLDGILRSLGETARTMQQGGGVGIDFTPLRPAGAAAARSGSIASGPVSFMALWDALCETLLSTEARRGAMMGTLACDHPDIEAFIAAKSTPGKLRNFNLSILVNDAFMQAVSEGADWPLTFPSRLLAGPDASETGVCSSIPARTLWRQIAAAAHAHAEPGILFADTINRENNLRYCESISTTNPCGEIPLPSHGCCDLGSINLAAFVRRPFGTASQMDFTGIEAAVAMAVRFLDDIIDLSRFPLPAQAEQARQTRRIGLGITGLADALAMLGLGYGSGRARQLAADVLRTMRDAAYQASIELAAEKGAFPRLDCRRYVSAPFVTRLPAVLRTRIARSGTRNSHLLSIAPAGTISLLAGNVSSGIEPIFALEGTRRVRDAGGQPREYPVQDYAYGRWLSGHDPGEALPSGFDTAAELPARAHLDMQAALQPYVDNAISKTINLPAGASVDDVASIYSAAHSAGIKGCTVYREGASVGHVLGRRPDTHCCSVDREAD
jgi:ribonucleoside-diphosphate reductase alpha chain